MVGELTEYAQAWSREWASVAVALGINATQEVK